MAFDPWGYYEQAIVMELDKALDEEMMRYNQEKNRRREEQIQHARDKLEIDTAIQEINAAVQEINDETMPRELVDLIVHFMVLDPSKFIN